ncbi:hypothetical protein ARMGADRAFT_920285 [Armillaria gallica]|uniref:Uncharacterized protein n=1 Tax=Armillaria gallica TaxID=47427 RepID=A0A2H3DSV8_ARMGA|nr:hypothetical protein ARMGADRAFT_920285 [Armillaria gallica]
MKGHQARQFLKSLTTYLPAHGCRLTPQGFDGFDLYKRITLQLPAIPQVGRKDLKNIVCATPPVPAQGQHAAEAAWLDFAYIQMGERNECTEGSSVEGLHITHVHAIFQLPAVYNVPVAAPLAYVEWFTPFGQQDLLTGLYSISRSTWMGHVYSEIIDVNRIIQNCHLLPH